MSDSIVVEIDRLVINGPELTPGRARDLRARIEREVRRLLDRADKGESADDAEGRDEAAQLGPSVLLTGAFSENRLIELAAARIAREIRSRLDETAG